MIRKLEEILYPHQIEAVRKLHNGSILCGGVGTGKSLTALGYYWSVTSGKMDVPLIIITTAHKRDSKEWDAECLRFGIQGGRGSGNSTGNLFHFVDVQFLVIHSDYPPCF